MAAGRTADQDGGRPKTQACWRVPAAQESAALAICGQLSIQEGPAMSGATVTMIVAR